MIRVGLVHTKPSYAGLAPPFGPGVAYPEFAHWGGTSAGGSSDNHVYSAVREALHALGLDEARFGQADWNPLGQFVDAGSKVVLKPNFIRHWNPLEGGDENASLESVVTHGAVLRAMADYAFLASNANPSRETRSATARSTSARRASSRARASTPIVFVAPTTTRARRRNIIATGATNTYFPKPFCLPT